MFVGENTPQMLATKFGHANVLKLFEQWKCKLLARNKVTYDLVVDLTSIVLLRFDLWYFVHLS
jgi:hypothetical protein